MHKLKLSFKLIYKLIVVGILCLLSSTEEIAAAESQVKITGIKNKAGQLAVSFEAYDFLAGKAIEFLNKGFTIKLNYTIELWKSRSFWFDKPVAQRKIEHVIIYDIIRREYSCFRKVGEKISEETLFKIEQLVDWATKFMDVEISQIEKLQKNALYYYSINAELNMLISQKVVRLKTESEKFRITADYIKF